MARPPKDKSAQKRRHVIFRVTDAEYADLQAVAIETGLTVNELSRRTTLAGQKRVIVKRHAHCDPALLKRLERIGHNLNQLVKTAHIFGRVSPMISQLCERINLMIDEALAADEK